MPPKIPMCVRDEKEDALRKMQVPPTSDNMGSLREHVQKREQLRTVIHVRKLGCG